MIFFTILLLIIYSILLIKGNVCYKKTIKIGELELKKSELNSRTEKENIGIQQLLNLLPILTLIPIIIMEFAYYTFALNVDIHKYPTLFMLGFLILSFVFNFKTNKKPDLKTEEGKEQFKINLYQNNKKRTVKGTILNILRVLYFCYMFYILVFVL